ncbi:hypothetical protein ACSNOH_16930 [Streptomyces sp. URMC 127]
MMKKRMATDSGSDDEHRERLRERFLTAAGEVLEGYGELIDAIEASPAR